MGHTGASRKSPYEYDAAWETLSLRDSVVSRPISVHHSWQLLCHRDTKKNRHCHWQWRFFSLTVTLTVLITGSLKVRLTVSDSECDCHSLSVSLSVTQLLTLSMSLSVSMCHSLTGPRFDSVQFTLTDRTPTVVVVIGSSQWSQWLTHWLSDSDCDGTDWKL